MKYADPWFCLQLSINDLEPLGSVVAKKLLKICGATIVATTWPQVQSLAAGILEVL